MALRLRSRRWLVFVSGLSAMAAAIALGFALRAAVGLATLPEVVGTGLVLLIPGDLFELGIRYLGLLAKRLLFVALNVGQLLVGGGLAVALGQVTPLRPQTTRQVARFLALSIAAPMLTLGVLIVAVGGIAALAEGLTALALTSLVYGIALTVVAGRKTAADDGEVEAPAEIARKTGSAPLSRRGLMLSGAAALATLAGAATLARTRLAGSSAADVSPPAARRGEPSTPGLAPASATAAPTPTASLATGPGAPRPSGGQAGLPLPEGVTPTITPTDKFYSVSKNLVADPAIDARQWQLRVEGLVDTPLTLGLSDLQALPGVEKQHTLTCVSNFVGGKLISNAVWKGVRLADLLRQAGAKEGVRRVVVSAADDYADSFPLERGLDPETLLVYEMNGEPLPQKHGYPLRLLLPDIYGMTNVKWITRIELIDSDFLGYWQQGGWSNDAIIKTSSRIDVARASAVDQLITAAGVAFAGKRGVSAVEVSDDGGQTWQRAEVKAPNTPNVWSLWVAQWLPRTPGPVSVLVRAIDGSGEVQTSAWVAPFPAGGSGLHSVEVRIK